MRMAQFIHGSTCFGRTIIPYRYVLTRTIIEDLHPESMTVRVTGEGTEFAVVRTTTGVGWQVNNSGVRWYHSLLDSGPVSDEFELKMDANGVANIAYTRAGKRFVCRLMVSISEQILAREITSHSAVGLDLDLNRLAQIATTSFDAGQTELSIFKSLKINRQVVFPIRL